MKAITISQPFATLIADGEKWIENRTWQTNYRGPIAIHAGKGQQYLSKAELVKYPTAQIIAVGNLTACVPLSAIQRKSESPDRKKLIAGTQRNWSEAARHEHAEGPYCWILEDVKKLETPVEIAGKQGLWNWEAE